jgi:Holliday junction resolvase
MKEQGYHTERVAASGRRKFSVCDLIMFSKQEVFMVEVKSTREVKFRIKGLHGVVETATDYKVVPLLAIYFKSSHSSMGKGCWVMKRLDKQLVEVRKDDRSDQV